MSELLNRVYLGNTVQTYLTALGVFLFSLLLVLIFKKIVLLRLKKWADKTETTVDDLLIRGIERTLLPLLYYLALWASVKVLSVSDAITKGIRIASIVLVTFLVIRTIAAVIKFSLNSYIMRRDYGESKRKQLRGIFSIITFIIWTLGLLFLLDNLGINISAVIAGLGIGGIAIALAAQAVLGDVFSYFVIFFDRPFEIGDFIVVGDKSGTVENIGIKTSRVRSLTGEQLIFSNTDLTSSRVHNYKRMERRRVVFKFGVVYNTSPEKVEQIPGLIRHIIESVADTTFDRSHFISYGDFSLLFETVYFVNSPDYNKYMDIHQKINLRILSEFNSRGIHFAYPTQTLYLNKEKGFDDVKTEIVPIV